MALLPLRMRRESNDDPFKSRVRRSLIVGVIAIALIILCLYYSDNSTLAPYVPSVLTRKNRRNMFLRSSGPRALIFITSDKIDETLCYSAGSAYLNGLPVVVAGYEMPYNGAMSTLDFMEKAIKNTELKPSDVVIVMDSDTVFTGVDIDPYLNHFIEHSAATPEELDAVAVRQGRAMAPFLASADDRCLADSMFKSREACALGYESVHERMRRYAAAHPEHKLSLLFDQAPHRHMNAGVVVARVWAYKEFLQQAFSVTKTQAPPVKTIRGWFTDQSIYTALYLDLLAWEVMQDVFSMPMKKQQSARSPYGIRAGLIGLDFSDTPSIIGSVQYIHQSELNDEHWAKYLPEDGSQHQHSHDTISLKSMNQFVKDLYTRAYGTHGEEIYTKLSLPKWAGGKSTLEETQITLTPPLLALKPRSAGTSSNEGRTFPAIFHAAGLNRGITKIKQMEYGAISARWFVPMVYDEKAKEQAMEYLKSVPLFLSTSNSITWDSYHNKCGFPFGGIIDKAKKIR